MRTERILERIQTAFAEAIEAGELDAAEGWIAVATWVRNRSGAPLAVPAGR
jgi:hypothetical protein